MDQKLKSLYERYHRGRTRFQKRVIGKKNFTYRLILNILGPYLIGKKRILDIGCGAGTLSFYMARQGNEVMGIDISSKAIAMCKISSVKLGLRNNITFQSIDFLKTKINEFFDLILCSEVLEHLVNDQIVVQKIFQTLKNGGIAVISVPSKNTPIARIGFTKKFDKEVGHLRRYDADQLVNLLERQRFKILEIRKTEGILRNFLFVSGFTGQIVRVANRFTIISDLFTFIDNITLKLLGESQIIVVAQKPKKK